MRKAVILLVFVAFPLTAVAGDLQLAVDRARGHIATRHYIAAADALKGALEDVKQLAPEDRQKAAAAVHFYSAVALSGMGENTEAAAHLQEFFALVPDARLSAPEKYESGFVKLFRETQPKPTTPQVENAEFLFDTYYPGFADDTAGTIGSKDELMFWNAAMVILASKREKNQWESVASETGRETFKADFWKRRDPTPETAENEFRDRFVRRVAFAEHAFETENERGSMGDRGRVFVLLGVPSSVRRRPLTPRDPIQIVESGIVVNGSIEQWVYASEQLPRRLAKKYVTYRFVTQKGIGENVLQREEPYAVQALLLAMSPYDAARKKD